MRLKALSALCAASLLTACVTATIRPQGGAPTAKEASYSESQSFFLWGLAPKKKTVNVEEICKGKKVSQLQTQHSFLDGFLGAITFGIYAPRTARVWCQD